MVIAIIAILAALLFPALARAKEKANGIKCVANLKQIGVAFFMYADDNADSFPTTSGFNGSGGWRGTGSYALEEGGGILQINRSLNAYVGLGGNNSTNSYVFGLLACPSDKGEAIGSWVTPPGVTIFQINGCSYREMLEHTRLARANDYRGASQPGHAGPRVRRDAPDQVLPHRALRRQQDHQR